jgi:MFS family permease
MSNKKTFTKYSTLTNRGFIGFLIAEFLAAFNDQCIHAAAMFFAIRTGTMEPSQAISLMPLLFYSPWAIFSTLAGYFADRYGKRFSLIFWKLSEVVIAVVALYGFWLGTLGGSPGLGAAIVLGCVFMMGTHSAFYVPNKYGVLPEIFESQVLSKANGLVESTSFLAVILGTAMGGVLSTVWGGSEYLIGIFLCCSALLGAVASFFISNPPAADPTRPFPGLLPWKLYAPLLTNLRDFLSVPALRFALSGIAFFTFMVAFMRATMYMHGESQNPPWTEQKVSTVVAAVALGVGLGSPLAGWLSRGRVELGFVPLGSLGMIVATIIASVCVSTHSTPGLIAALISIGFAAGFYIVPLYTLMQHRAPKQSKGTAVATSNFINVTGAITASVAFFVLVEVLRVTGISTPVTVAPIVTGVLQEKLPQRSLTVSSFRVLPDGGGEPYVVQALPTTARAASDSLLTTADDETPLATIIKIDSGVQVGSRVTVSTYSKTSNATGELLSYVRLHSAEGSSPTVYDAQKLPTYLFLVASCLALLVLLMLLRLLPDLFLRALLRLTNRSPIEMRLDGDDKLPKVGPIVLTTEETRLTNLLGFLASLDRRVTFLVAPTSLSLHPTAGLMGWLMRFLQIVLPYSEQTFRSLCAGSDRVLVIAGADVPLNDAVAARYSLTFTDGSTPTTSFCEMRIR